MLNYTNVPEWIYALNTELQQASDLEEITRRAAFGLHGLVIWQSALNTNPTFAPITQGIPEKIIQNALRDVYNRACETANTLPDQHNSLLQVLQGARQCVRKIMFITD